MKVPRDALRPRTAYLQGVPPSGVKVKVIFRKPLVLPPTHGRLAETFFPKVLSFREFVVSLPSKPINILMCLFYRCVVAGVLWWCAALPGVAQELQVKVTVNSQQVEGSDKSVFEDLQQKMEQFMNEHQWTELQFQKNERIVCNFNLTVSKYDRSTNTMTCSAMIQANRPVYNSAYTSTLYNNKDGDFNFEYVQFTQLNYNEEVIDNQLMALMAYYAYLIIGLDLDSFSPMGGTEVLQRCMTLTNNAQDLGFAGWKSFDDSRNRFAIINDYLDEAMKPFRQLQYDYYRTGLDEMASNAERGRVNVSTALENLKKAHEERPLSLLPQIWTDYKRDELANIYKGKGTQKEKQAVYDILFNINPSQSDAWNKLKE